MCLTQQSLDEKQIVVSGSTAQWVSQTKINYRIYERRFRCPECGHRKYFQVLEGCGDPDGVFGRLLVYVVLMNPFHTSIVTDGCILIGLYSME